MAQYLVRRLLVFIIVLFFITVFSFLIMRFAPGDPIQMMIDPETPVEVIERMREVLGLNDPLHIQYFKWLEEVLQGNLGYSMHTHEPITKMIFVRVGPTMLLLICSLFLSLLLSVLVGVFSAMHQNSMPGHASSGGAILFISIPTYFTALGVLYIFALKLRWLPVGGMYTLGGNGSFGDLIRHLILPIFVMTINWTGVLVRYVRSSMLEILNQDYLRTARAKGLREYIVIYKHALRNAINPVVTISGVILVYGLGGSVVVEKIFSWPGLGQLIYSSVMLRDYSTIMGINLIMGVMVLMINLLIDIIYAAIDPRIKLN